MRKLLHVITTIIIMIAAAMVASHKGATEHFGGPCEPVVPPANCSRSWACFNRTAMRMATSGQAECQAYNGQCIVHRSDQECQAWADAMNNTRLQSNLANTYQTKACDRECYDDNSNCSIALRELPRKFNCLPNARATI